MNYKRLKQFKIDIRFDFSDQYFNISHSFGRLYSDCINNRCLAQNLGAVQQFIQWIGNSFWAQDLLVEIWIKLFSTPIES